MALFGSARIGRGRPWTVRRRLSGLTGRRPMSIVGRRVSMRNVTRRRRYVR